MTVLVTLALNILLYVRLEPASDKGETAARLIAGCAMRGVLAAQTFGEFLAVVSAGGRHRPVGAFCKKALIFRLSLFL